jgi:hypothetical protein
LSLCIDSDWLGVLPPLTSLENTYNQLQSTHQPIFFCKKRKRLVDLGTGLPRMLRHFYLLVQKRNKLSVQRKFSTKLFDEFRKKAADILTENADGENTSRVAFYLFQFQLENEKKLLLLGNEKKLEVLEMEMEKKLEVLKMEMENKLDLQKIESDHTQRQLAAYNSKLLSAVVQRLVVCMSTCIVNLCVHLFFSPRLISSFFSSFSFSFLCCVVMQTSCRELSEKCRRRLQER